jgi:hypothetical protein
MHLVLYIGLGAGLAIAAGLRPFLPALLAGALASGKVLGLTFSAGGYSFLQAGGWLVAVTAALLISYLVQLRLGSQRLEPGPVGAALAGVGVGVAALLFAGTLAGHHDLAWPGLVGGAVCGALSQAAVRPLLARTRARLAERTARDALTVYLDGAALVLTALVALVHPLGYVAVALVVWLLVASRRRAGEKYAGLRILRQ